MSPVLASATVQLILPLVSAWVKCQEASILRNGVPLTSSLQADASRLGIKHAQRVRLRAIDQVPGGMPRWLRALVTPLGLCSPLTSGMSLRYGIFIRSDAWGDRRLVRHELVHTLQYERFGGIWRFLKLYLYECLAPPGYPFGPLEQEAIRLSSES